MVVGSGRWSESELNCAGGAVERGAHEGEIGADGGSERLFLIALHLIN